MAPEEILNNVDESRREFLKKVIAGTTFAVPLMASFSMEGLSIESAWASNMTTNMPLCANQTTGSPCCTLAVEIACILGISPLTVSKHVANILKKMGASSRAEAGVRALRDGLIS